jgi:lactate dehydrogenase-like 2-hydroxyacid dehydrogenase
MTTLNNKFKKVVVLDTVIFYPEHRRLLNSISEEVLEYPTSLPDGLEKQYAESPELFLNKQCYTQIASDNTPLQLLMNRVDGADVIISCWTDIPDEILRLNPQLKLIIFWTHEREHRVNLKLARELGITVANVPDYGTDAVAEVVFAGLWQLLLRNFGTKTNTESGDKIANSIIGHVFNYFRKLQDNEKRTRSGKFTHHFHKIGLAKFNFDQKNIDELIPEQLIEYKKVGLLNIIKADEVLHMLSAFGIICEQYKNKDTSLAAYYKFLAENDLVFFDSKSINQSEIIKIKSMFGDKLVDAGQLPSTNYSFNNKTFGVIGLGRIGIKVASIAKRLGFEVIYYSKKQKIELENELGIKYVALETLVETSDIVSVHVPAHKAENLLDGDLIAKLKHKSTFINTADGNAINQRALTERMLAGEVFAYLDVYPGLPRKDVLGIPMADKTDWKIHKELSNNVLAYRAGWKTQESIKIKTYKLLGEMIGFLVGKKDELLLPDEL